ncbi:hypothetical protein FKP32DRAFT_1549617, partial [Trametes sanguinea]
ITVHGVFFTTLVVGQSSSTWRPSTVASVFEMRESALGCDRQQWVVTIAPPPPHEMQMVNLMSVNWTLHWEESMGLVLLCQEANGRPILYHCLLIRERGDFMRFVYVCSNIRMLLYTGVM